MFLGARLRHGLRPNRAQQGFALATIFVVISMIAIVAYFAASPSLKVGTSASYVESVRADTIIKQAADMQAGYLSMNARGIIPASVTFNTHAATGLFGAGGVSMQTPPREAFSTIGNGDGFWIYRAANGPSYIVANSVGTAAGADAGVVLSGLRKEVCVEINRKLHGVAAAPSWVSLPVAKFRSASTTQASPTEVTAIPLGLMGVAAVKGWESGCMGTPDGFYVYFHIFVPG